MPATAPVSAPTLRPASLAANLVDLLVSPEDAFDRVLAAPPRLLTWLLPTLLVALTSVLLLGYSAANKTTTVSDSPEMTDAGAAQAASPVVGQQKVAELATCAGAFAGTFWSAFLLWFMGRAFLRAPFPYRRALEVVALTSFIAALGALFTLLLISLTGDPAARPALSLFTPHLPTSEAARQFLEMVNLFQLWSTAVLAVGLSRLSGVSFKECAFWVFGYWLVARLALLVLA